MNDPTESKPSQIGSNLFQDVTKSSIQVQGNIDASLHAAGDIVGGDKIVTINYQHSSIQSIDAKTLAEATAAPETAKAVITNLAELVLKEPGLALSFNSNTRRVGAKNGKGGMMNRKDKAPYSSFPRKRNLFARAPWSN